MSKEHNRLFEGDDHATHYATYLPLYPPEVEDTILEYLDSGEDGRGLTIDVAYGSAQSTKPLAQHFW